MEIVFDQSLDVEDRSFGAEVLGGKLLLPPVFEAYIRAREIETAEEFYRHVARCSHEIAETLDWEDKQVEVARRQLCALLSPYLPVDCLSRRVR